MSSPDQSAVAASSTMTAVPSKSIVVPAERAEAKNRMESIGKPRSRMMVRMTPPT